MDKLDKKIAIIGAGHMGNSLMKGLISSGFKKKNIFISNKLDDNRKVAEQADWIILAVKPLVIYEVIQQIRDVVYNKLLISAAAAVNISTIERTSENKKQKVIRIMPNLPVAYNQGIIGLYANKTVSQAEKDNVVNFLSLLGIVLEVKTEQELDSLTLISACGPAVVSCFMTMFSKTAILLGLSKNDSELLAVKTFGGTLNYLQKTGLSTQELQNAVATKGGVTEEIISSMEANKIYSYFEDSIKKGKVKIDKLRKEVNINGNN